MAYLVRLSDRTLRDLEPIYEYVQADQSDKAFAWFNGLEEAVYSFEKYPNREQQRMSEQICGICSMAADLIFTVSFMA